MKTKLLLFALILSSSIFSQNVGIGTTSPTNTLHVVPLGTSDPLKIEGINSFGSEQNLLIINPATGVVKHMHIDSLTSRLNITPDTGIDSVKFLNDSLYIFENGKVFVTYINTFLDTTLVNNLIYAKTDSMYTLISDSLVHDILWLSELKDSIDSDIDSANLQGDTSLLIYEDGKVVNADISGLRDSAEWVDGKLLGLTSGDIYARKIFQTRGDTIVIKQNSRMGIMTNNPNAYLDIRGIHDQHLRIGALNQGGNITFVRGFDGTTAGEVGFNTASTATDFTVANYTGSGEVNIVTNPGAFDDGHFSVSSPGGTSPGTHLMVKNSGLVGVGKINPEAKLDINFAKDLSSGALGIKDWLGVVTGATKSDATHMGLSIGVDTISNKSHIYSRLTNGTNQIRPIDFNDSALFIGGFLNSKRVGIGTSNPTGQLDIRGAFYNQVKIGSAGSAGGINFADGAGGYGVFIGYQNFNETDTFQILNGSGGSVFKIKTNGGMPSGIGGGFYVENVSAGNPGVFFAVRNTGNVGIGTVNPTERLEVCGNVKVVGQIQANSSNLSAGLTCSSDERLKTNIMPISSALDKIKLIDGKTYNWRVEEFPTRGFTKEKQYGFIAQELEVNFPELVQTNPDGYKTVDYLELIPILTEALKEQDAKVELLEQQNKEIMNDLKELKKLIKANK